MVGWFSRLVIIPCFDFLGKFISNYGLVILLMTLLIKLIISPLTIKSYKSSAKMQVIKPEVDKLNQKYPNEKEHRETSAHRTDSRLLIQIHHGLLLLHGILLIRILGVQLVNLRLENLHSC